jgi:hypothetical protein
MYIYMCYSADNDSWQILSHRKHHLYHLEAAAACKYVLTLKKRCNLVIFSKLVQQQLYYEWYNHDQTCVWVSATFQSTCCQIVRPALCSADPLQIGPSEVRALPVLQTGCVATEFIVFSLSFFSLLCLITFLPDGVIKGRENLCLHLLG